jgi:hypothetical protein
LAESPPECKARSANQGPAATEQAPGRSRFDIFVETQPKIFVKSSFWLTCSLGETFGKTRRRVKPPGETNLTDFPSDFGGSFDLI